MTEKKQAKSLPPNGMHPIPASAITIGARFTENVYFDDGEHLFLPAGIDAKLYHEEAVARWKVPVLYSHGHLFSEDGGNSHEEAPAGSESPDGNPDEHKSHR